MNEYIKKEDVLFKKWQFKFKDVDGEHWFVNVKDIEKLPTYTFPDREKGEWVKNYWGERMCPFCDHIDSEADMMDAPSNFCPNCGADMRGDK